MSDNETLFDGFRQVLVHLHDDAFLQTNDLVRELVLDASLSPRERANRLRTRVLRAIEDLSPGPDASLRSSGARSYNVLNLHYGEGLMVREVSRELAISQRQVYRDLRTAEERLWQIVRDSIHAAGSTTTDVSDGRDRAELVTREVERLSGVQETLAFSTILDGVLRDVSALSSRLGIAVRSRVHGGLGQVTMDRQVARHALLSLVSHLLQRARGPEVTVMVARRGAAIDLALECQVDKAVSAEELVPVACEQLLRHTGSHCAIQVEDGLAEIKLLLRGRLVPTVVVIDDNEGLAALYERYLEGHGCRALWARDGATGIELVSSSGPELVILDVMMPQQDGWETLQALQNNDDTRNIPVVVCSVLDDPELAYSLGASCFLPKPVTDEALAECLQRFGLGS